MTLPKSFFSEILNRGNLILLDKTIYHISTANKILAKDYWSFCGNKYKLEKSANILDYEREYFMEYEQNIIPLIDNIVDTELKGREQRIKTGKDALKQNVNKRYVDFIVNKVFKEFRAKGDIFEKYDHEYFDITDEPIIQNEVFDEKVEVDIYGKFLQSFFENGNDVSGWDILKHRNFAIIDNESYDLVPAGNYNEQDFIQVANKRYTLILNPGLQLNNLEQNYQLNLDKKIKDIVLDKNNNLLKNLGELDDEEKLIELSKKKEYQEDDSLGFIQGKGSYTVYIGNLKLTKLAIKHYVPNTANPRVATDITLGRNNSVVYKAPYFLGGNAFPCHGGWNMTTLRKLSPERQVAMLLYHGRRMAERIEFRNGQLVTMH